jgi:hypothetical protein
MKPSKFLDTSKRQRELVWQGNNEMLSNKPTNKKHLIAIYRIKIKWSGNLPNKTYGWEIYRNSDVLPVLRSQQPFVSRAAGLADANQSRLQLVDADPKRAP